MFNRKYVLNTISLDKTVSQMLLYRLNENMNYANKFEQNWFELGFELKTFIKTSIFSGVKSIEDLEYEISKLQVIKNLSLACDSRYWPITFKVTGNSIENAILNFRIGGN